MENNIYAYNSNGEYQGYPDDKNRNTFNQNLYRGRLTKSPEDNFKINFNKEEEKKPMFIFKENFTPDLPSHTNNDLSFGVPEITKITKEQYEKELAIENSNSGNGMIKVVDNGGMHISNITPQGVEVPVIPTPYMGTTQQMNVNPYIQQPQINNQYHNQQMQPNIYQQPNNFNIQNQMYQQPQINNPYYNQQIQPNMYQQSQINQGFNKEINNYVMNNFNNFKPDSMDFMMNKNLFDNGVRNHNQQPNQTVDHNQLAGLLYSNSFNKEVPSETEGVTINNIMSKLLNKFNQNNIYTEYVSSNLENNYAGRVNPIDYNNTAEFNEFNERIDGQVRAEIMLNGPISEEVQFNRDRNLAANPSEVSRMRELIDKYVTYSHNNQEIGNITSAFRYVVSKKLKHNYPFSNKYSSQNPLYSYIQSDGITLFNNDPSNILTYNQTPSSYNTVYNNHSVGHNMQDEFRSFSDYKTAWRNNEVMKNNGYQNTFRSQYNNYPFNNGNGYYNTNNRTMYFNTDYRNDMLEQQRQNEISKRGFNAVLNKFRKVYNNDNLNVNNQVKSQEEIEFEQLRSYNNELSNKWGTSNYSNIRLLQEYYNITEADLGTEKHMNALSEIREQEESEFYMNFIVPAIELQRIWGLIPRENIDTTPTFSFPSCKPDATVQEYNEYMALYRMKELEFNNRMKKREQKSVKYDNHLTSDVFKDGQYISPVTIKNGYGNTDSTNSLSKFAMYNRSVLEKNITVAENSTMQASIDKNTGIMHVTLSDEYKEALERNDLKARLAYNKAQHSHQ